MVDFKNILEFYKDKRVFVTGHTGFKGTWLCRILAGAGAIVTGYSLEAPTDPSLFELSGLSQHPNMTSVIGDVRDYESLRAAFAAAGPEIVFHLAAQPLVIESYRRPAYTYETNVMGTVNLLECVREVGGVRSLLNVTTDKVYYNDESGIGFTEDMPLDGYDPYSNSKSCSEIVTHGYCNSFFRKAGIPVSTARAGNVIGGGDFADNRIVPDCVRAGLSKHPILIRNPRSVRPFQHVLEPLFAYLTIAARQYEDSDMQGAYNVGPEEEDCVTTGRIAELFCKAWGEGMRWENTCVEGPHEAGYLRLDCAKIKKTFDWRPVWNIDTAITKSVEWSKDHRDGMEAADIMDRQIAEYLEDAMRIFGEK